MSDTLHCPDCGLPLPPDAPQGECPRCLLRAGLESQPAVAGVAPSGVAGSGADPIAVTRTSSGHSNFVPPTVAELQQRIPQYEILELIGQGGMGAVYKARQRGLERIVAIKILPFEVGHSVPFTERFTREARALALLSHPHIVAVHDFGQAEGMCYFVMEYVAGVNLRQAIQAGKMNPAEALAIVPQICEALQFAHDEGVVHRDIKPENILIDLRGRVKIADFGLAKLLGTQTPEHSLTGTQQVMGTLRYMAPEQMFGSKEVDHRADIFSLGVVFYELLTGELPIGRFAPPSKKSVCDARLDEVVLRALEAEPAERYQHVSEMKTGVEAIARQPPVQASTPRATARSESITQVTPPPQQSFVGTNYHLLLCFALSLATLWFVLYFAAPVITMIDGPDAELLKVGHDWDLGTSVNSIVSTLLVVFVALMGATIFAWWQYRAAGLKQLRDAGINLPLPSGAAERSGEPRLSQAALWGAILAPLSLITLLMVAGSTIVVHDGHAGPPIALRLLAMLLLIPGIVGLFSPFATTLLGILAIAQIRNAKGKLYGLPLAVFDALAYPLLVLDAVLLTIGYLLLAFLFSDVMRLTYNTPLRNWGPGLLTAVLILPLVIVLNVWLVRLTWRAATDSLNASPAPTPPRRAAALPLNEPATPRLSLAALWGAILSPTVLLPVLLIVGSVLVSESPPSAGPNSPAMMRATPTWVMMPVMCVGLPGLIAPFATTLLGVLAIGNIRRSNGKLYGLPLAVFDALLFPLLLLDVILVWLGFLLFVLVLTFMLQVNDAGNLTLLGPLLITGVLIVPLVIVLDLWLIRLTWQAASAGLTPDVKKPLSPKDPPSFRPQGTGTTSNALIIVLVVLAIFAIPTLLASGVLAAYFFSSGTPKSRNYPEQKWLYEPTQEAPNPKPRRGPEPDTSLLPANNKMQSAQ